MPAINLERHHNNVPFIKLRVNGEQEERLFMIDTGADMSLLDNALIDHLETRRRGTVEGANGRTEGSSVHCTFNLLHKKLTELMRPGDNLLRLSHSLGRKLSGILGMDLLQQFSSFTIDNKNQKFRFEL